MPLGAGTRLGAYEILSPIGAGGMGEVYKARDTRLDRTVAIKVLPQTLAADADLRQRFEREARAVSSLSHPHICTLHDVGRHDGIDFLVMEYLDGQTLADRLAGGPLPPDQLFRYGSEIADALAKAHRSGVVHRDLKPGNVMLTKTGAKLLDFGLAKIGAPSGIAIPHAAAHSLRTEMTPLTGRGTILGTVQYMAPEQLEGRDADARTDIFAFGALIYEMATGARAFQGNSPASLISAILKDVPAPISSVRASLPRALDRLVSRCLEKDPDDRWQDATDLASELKWIAGDSSQAGAPAPVARRRRRWQAFAAAAIVAVGALAAGLWLGASFYAPRPIVRPVRFSVLAPERHTFTPAAVSGAAQFAISPDGSRLAFVASAPGNPPLLWVRPLDGLVAQPLPETEGASFPFWSPDSRSIGFFARGSLKKIPAAGGAPQSLCAAPSARGGSWSPEGVIVFSPAGGGGLERVSAAGGPAVPATTFRSATGQAVSAERWPHFLPDGRHFLYYALASKSEHRGIYVGSLDSTDTERLMSADAMAVYAQDHLLFVREGTLIAQPFDAARRQLRGNPIGVAERIRYYPNFGHAAFSVSRDGVLAYATGLASTTQLLWRDRAGKALGSIGSPGTYSGPELSPDEKRLAVTIVDQRAGSRPDIWLFDLARSTTVRLTFNPAADFFPIWSPDGSRLAFSSDRSGIPDLYQTRASGGGQDELLLETAAFRHPTDWTRDNRFIVYEETSSRGYDLWILPLSGDRKPTVFLDTPFNEAQGRLSPDGRWMAYISDESAALEVYVQPFPASGGKWQISTAGGSQPIWSRDGRELFYVAADRKLMSVAVTASPAGFEAGVPQALFEIHTPHVTAPYSYHYTVSADGRRFLVNTIIDPTVSPSLTIAVDWVATLTK